MLDQSNPDLVVFITDGDPTARNPAPDTNFPNGSLRRCSTRPCERQLVRADGTHMFVVGVGNGLTSGSSQVRLRAISGPDQYPAQPDIFKADYTLVTNFSDLQNALADLARSLCSVRVKVQKLVDNVGDGGQLHGRERLDFDGTVTVSGASNDAYRWLAPGAVTGPPSGGNTRTATTATTTDGVGYAEFAWLPNPTTLTSQIVLTDNGKVGYPLRRRHLHEERPDACRYGGADDHDRRSRQAGHGRLHLQEPEGRGEADARQDRGQRQRRHAGASAWTLTATGSGGFSGTAGSHR